MYLDNMTLSIQFVYLDFFLNFLISFEKGTVDPLSKINFFLNWFINFMLFEICLSPNILFFLKEFRILSFL